MSVIESRSRSAARPPNLRGDRSSTVLCVGAIAIGIVAATGYVLGNASLTSLNANWKPVPVVAAVALILLGAGLLALRSPAPTGLLTARRAALAVIVLAAADLLSAAFSRHLDEWQGWGAHGGVNVHAYPFAAILFIALGSALAFLTTRRDFAGHVIASAVLLICAVFSFASALSVPSFLDPSTRVVPAAVATLGLALISASELLARPRGWVVPLISRTSAGMMLRLLLPATILVPFGALALRLLIADASWFTYEVGLTVIVAVNVFFGAAIVLGAGVILHKRAIDRARLAAGVESSGDAIIGTSSAGLIVTWNAGAEQMYGYTAAEAISRSVRMLAPPERQDEAPLALEKLRRGERIGPVETVRVRKDGRRMDVELSVSPVLGEEGSLVGASSIARDITGRKNSEEEIRRMAEQHAVVLATSTDGYWLMDLDGRLLDVNDAYCRMSGYSREELLGLNIRDLDATETPEETVGRIRSIVESGFARFETKHRTKDNRILDIESSVSVWRAAGRMLVFVRDITQRKRTEEALRKSEAALKEAQRVAQVGHWEWSTVTGATVWSDEIYRMFGIPVGSVTPSYEFFFAMADPEDRRVLEEEVARVLASPCDVDVDPGASFDVRINTPAGGAVVLAQRFFSDRDAAGNVVGFHGTCQDITRRIASEQALRDSEAALAEAQQIAHIGSWILDPESGEATVSTETFRIFGIDPRQVVRIPKFLELVHEEDRAAVAACAAASADTGRLDVEFRIDTPLGTRVVHAVARKHETGGPRFSLIGTIQDITEMKAAEEALRQRTESLERSNADLERFNRAAVGREMRMIELKRQINDLTVKMGQPAPYVLPEVHAAMETS